MKLCTYHTPDGRPVRVKPSTKLPKWSHIVHTDGVFGTPWSWDTITKDQRIPLSVHDEAEAINDLRTEKTGGRPDTEWLAEENVTVIHADEWPRQVRAIVRLMHAHGWPHGIGNPLPSGHIPLGAGFYANRHHHARRAAAKFLADFL